jgi:hypothetical protein
MFGSKILDIFQGSVNKMTVIMKLSAMGPTTFMARPVSFANTTPQPAADACLASIGPDAG